MASLFLKKGLNLILRQQTNILSAALIIMSTVILSQVLGLVRERLLRATFGASNTLGIYQYATNIPDFLFQLTIAAALASSFIPVFSDYLVKNKQQEAHKMASTLLISGLSIFSFLGVVLLMLAPLFLQIFNLGGKFSNDDMALMANLMKIFIFGQLLFIIGSFFSAVLQSYSHFFIAGFAASMYNLGIIIGIWIFSQYEGIYSAPIGVILGGTIFILVQLPLVKKIGFSFNPAFSLIRSEGITKIVKLMWPRTISIAIFQLGTITIASLISFLSDPGRMYVIYNSAQILSFAPVVLFGQTIAQAAFPILSREREKLDYFKTTFLTSFNQMLYLVLPISVLFLVLRIPIVRLIFGAAQFDWPATVLTGRTLAFFSISIFAQALITLLLKGFYAIHNTKTPLVIGAISTGLIVILSYLFIAIYKLGVESIAIAYSIASVFHLVVLFILLDKKVGGFDKKNLIFPIVKIFLATFFTGFALYIPIKLLDQLVFDTTRTINLILLTGTSSFIGLSLYLFLTWFFNVKEATTFLLIFKKLGNWREILGKSEEVIDTTRLKP